MKHARVITALIAICLLALAAGYAQDVIDEFDDFDDPEAAPEAPKSSLQPRPETDQRAEAWARAAVTTRPRALSTLPGVLLRHVMSPDGERFYYFRATDTEAGRRFTLHTVGPNKSESSVAETGAECLPPLFLRDGRILFTTRRVDTNDDGVLDAADAATLVVSNRDGGNQRTIAQLQPGDTPVAVWRNDREVLIAETDDDGVNGWIVSMNLVRGDRQRLTRGFNVELVLDDGRLLIERQQSAVVPRQQGRRVNRFGEVEDADQTPPEPPAPTLADHSAHILFNPDDGTEETLYSPSRRARFVLTAEGSFFGNQEPDEGDAPMRWSPWGAEIKRSRYSELLIVDDPRHYDTRSPNSRFSYLSIGWVNDCGLLAIEQGNLGSRLLLIDRALKTHRLASFDLSAQGFVASADGLTIGWLSVTDTDQNGFLEPWRDHSRIYFMRIE